MTPPGVVDVVLVPDALERLHEAVDVAGASLCTVAQR